MSQTERTIEQIKELKQIIQMVDAGIAVKELTDWEYNFIQDKVIFIEENGELQDDLSFSPAVHDKVDELWEKLKDYL